MTDVTAVTVPAAVAPAHRRAAAVLFLLAALIPESLATANNPPLNLVLNPVLLAFLVAFYGGAAVAIREARVRLRLRWSGTLLLGVAFGFANEGVVAATWYTVAPTGYTYLGGVDVAWANLLTIFHAVFSVVIPILVVETLFPAAAHDRWVGRTGLVVSAALPSAICLLVLNQPQWRAQRLVVLLLIAVLVLIAVRLRRPASPPAPAVPVAVPAPSPARVRWAGIGATLAFFAVGYLLPGIANSVAPTHLRALQPVFVLALLVVAGAGLTVAWFWTRRSGWGPRHVLAGLTGLLLPAIVLTNVQPAAALGGALLLSVPFVALLVWLARRTGRAARREAQGDR